MDAPLRAEEAGKQFAKHCGVEGSDEVALGFDAAVEQGGQQQGVRLGTKAVARGDGLEAIDGPEAAVSRSAQGRQSLAVKEIAQEKDTIVLQPRSQFLYRKLHRAESSLATDKPAPPSEGPAKPEL